MNNYIIYRIRDNTNGDTYIGSTRTTLVKRMRVHKTPSSKCKSRNIIDNNNYTVKVLLKMYCSKTTARWLERFAMSNHYNVINYDRSIITKKEEKEKHNECMREWHKNNKERNKKYWKEYGLKNKEKIREYKREWRKKQRALKQETYHCPCGKSLKITGGRERAIKRHEEGIRHINRMKKIKNNE